MSCRKLEVEKSVVELYGFKEGIYYYVQVFPGVEGADQISRVTIKSPVLIDYCTLTSTSPSQRAEWVGKTLKKID